MAIAASKPNRSMALGIVAVVIVIIAAVGFFVIPKPIAPTTSSTSSAMTTIISNQSNQTVQVQNHTLTLAVGQSGNVVLPVNPTTGTSWWVQSASPGIDVADFSGINASINCSQMVGCSNQLIIYSFKANTPGNYAVELRLGHTWAHNEYYVIDMVHITVNSTVP